MSTKKVVIIDKDIESIVPTFLENRVADISLLKKCLENSEMQEIESIGHKMAGNAGGYGFHDLGIIGREIESAAQANDKESISKLTDQVEQYLSSIEVKYE